MPILPAVVFSVWHCEGRHFFSSDGIFFLCVRVCSTPVQQLRKDMWADRRALCFHLVAAKGLLNIIRICMLFNGFRVFLMSFQWKKKVIHGQGTTISIKRPLLEHHNAIGREMSSLWAVSWPPTVCLPPSLQTQK